MTLGGGTEAVSGAWVCDSDDADSLLDCRVSSSEAAGSSAALLPDDDGGDGGEEKLEEVIGEDTVA